LIRSHAPPKGGRGEVYWVKWGRLMKAKAARNQFWSLGGSGGEEKGDYYVMGNSKKKKTVPHFEKVVFDDFWKQLKEISGKKNFKEN